jgi:ElaB/YqjD/DUF883 family membrane-anchored ribosome-binding protein
MIFMETIKAPESAHEAIDKIANAAYQAVEALDQKGEQLKNIERQLINNSRDYIHDNPVTSLGMAVVAGFLLSRML